ncbi:putative Pyruvate-formate lyase-activating enzyme [Methanocella conradii HZ254]|uniref:Pyruvate-formate lyase-activating enzyme n=1 Tax=Methanocella conradii (strain DSM 24694 / JCM 17849 / CGMCC 1.5162 / HZ254) TaxID=1041930 RepID=H8I5R6_METCZ|nr:AmmeMemoRadiSam system radical SAM enzyme [Methanocella conradii]AFC99733.1 putative Pyruvate-formate lyase-activating enzyme [Methanocella conradii HZ254]MDI6896551.1 AmmeMemoRadiSam system radical SAM enzyme [Methanocella conradii]
MMKEAILWTPLEHGKAKCSVCSYRCVIPPGGVGHCRTRKNVDGRVFSMIYGTVTSEASDPIEKKPLYHFYPGSYSYSVGSVGCNFRCQHCQNWGISQADIQQVYSMDIMPEEVAQSAVDTMCRSVSWTYNEPGIWVEYAHDCAVKCHEKGVKTVYVTNGYPTPEHLEAMKGLLDAFRVDIKAFTEDFYRKVCGARLEPVLDSTKMAKDMGMHVEVVNLLIPGLNDSPEEIKALSRWCLENLGPDTPIHFTRFHPMYHMEDRESTAVKTLERAHDIARDAGLNYVYLGNVVGHRYENTWCPKCDSLLIERYGFKVLRYNITADKKCPKCGEKIPIIGEHGR